MRRNASGPRSVGSLFIGKLPVFKALKLCEMERRWENIAGTQLAARTQPLRLDRGALIIVCETPAAAQMINMSNGSLIMRVKRQIGLDLPSVRAVVRRLDRNSRRSEPRTDRERLTVPQKAIDEALAEVRQTVHDPELALSIARAQAAAVTRYHKAASRE